MTGEPAHNVWDGITQLAGQGASGGPQPDASYDEGKEETQGKNFKVINDLSSRFT